MKIVFPKNGQTVSLITDEQRTFIDNIATFGSTWAIDRLKEIHDGRELSLPKPLIVEVDTQTRFEAILSEHDDFRDTVKVSGDGGKAFVYNLKTGTAYYLRIGGETVVFQTEAGQTRFLRIDGLYNVRDIGGKNIKQGLVYRGSCLCDNPMNITEAGKRVFKDILKIKTEIDLRAESDAGYVESAAGREVRLLKLPFRFYSENFDPCYAHEVAALFEALSDESIYPLYYHCYGGADRTGILSFFLEILAGDDEEYALTDYELTSLTRLGGTIDVYRDRNGEQFSDFFSRLKSLCPDKTLKDCVWKFLTDCGVSAPSLDKIVRLLRK